MANFYLIRDILQGAWHIHAGTLAHYYPLAMLALKGITAFSIGTEENESLPYNLSLSASEENSASEDKYIKVIPLKGVMLRNDAYCGPVGTRTIAKRLRDADQDENNLGTILLIDSGGGQASSVPELADAITACTKPVVAYVDGMACSAAMYAAAYCSEIIAYRDTAQLGCIGTMISLAAPQNMATNADGTTYVRLYADGSEEKNEEFEKALTGDFKLLKERILNPHNETFKADMRRLRPKVTEEHLKGRTYDASEVQGILVDSIGSLEHAAQRIQVLAMAQTPKKEIQSHQIFIPMNKYPRLASALGITELAVTEGQSSINEEQLQTLETALETALKKGDRIPELESRITELEKELEKKPGADPASIIKETDGPDTTDPEEETLFGRLNRMQTES